MKTASIWSLLGRAGLLVLFTGVLTAARVAFVPDVRALFAAPVLAADEVLLSSAETWNPPAVWIDARPKTAFDRKHIPGAHHLSLEANSNFDEDLFALDKSGALDGSRPVVVYCSSSGCQLSRDVAARLRDTCPGLKVFVLHGGWR